MGVDFNQLRQSSPADAATEPRRIFAALPSKAPKYGYPRDVQSEVWEHWHSRRDEPDLVIKMNTGGGKTVVGLMMLKSCLNEGVGPAVYVVPDRYLSEQVAKEATEVGIAVTTDEKSSEFRAGKAILIANVYKLVNGLSVFGTASSDRRIDIGTLLVDDAHACIATIEAQFTLSIDSAQPAYKALLEMFAGDLAGQSKPSYLDVANGDPWAIVELPFWAWAEKQDRVLKVLHPLRTSDDFRFVWPLIADVLPVCRVAVSGSRIQIAPPCPPIDRIPSITDSRRRIYMTATLPDDSVLVTHLGADPKSVSRPITPKSASDMGDRMILTPLETHPDANDAEVADILVRLAKSHNVVVIVPSRRRANFWRNVADAIHDRDSIDVGVQSLRDGHVGLVVLVNKYDGIDLPADACRVLAIDGLPETYGELERIEARALGDTDAFVTRQIQRIEQGMGRGVRSNDDWCAVVLMGSRLTERLYSAGGINKFSPATRAQLTLSRSVAELLRGKPISELEAVIRQCLNRDPAWVSASRSALDGVTYDGEREVSPAAIGERHAIDHAVVGQFRAAANSLQTAIDATPDSKLRGWLKQEAAAYRHFDDPVAAQNLVSSALSDNRAVLKPRFAAGYSRISGHADQARRCAEELEGAYPNEGQLLVGFSALIDELVPDPDSTDSFEEAWHSLGKHLGFASQRPERDYGDGPDVLWLLGDQRALVTECKSGVTTDFIARHDAAQLSHSVDWFLEQYDSSISPVPVLVHRVNGLHEKATARAGTQVVTFEKLEKLRNAVRDFAQSISHAGQWRDPRHVGERLANFALTAKQFVNAWTVTPR